MNKKEKVLIRMGELEVLYSGSQEDAVFDCRSMRVLLNGSEVNWTNLNINLEKRGFAKIDLTLLSTNQS